MRTLAGPQRCLQQTGRSSPRAAPFRRTLRHRSSSLHVSAVLEKEEPKLAEQSEAARQHLEHLLPPSLSHIKPPARHLSPGEPDTVFYFAYGANLCLQTLARRGVSTPPLRSPSVVCDPSIRLVFKHRGGYSTLLQLQPGEQAKYTPYAQQVHGVLYQLSKQDLQKLAKAEGGYKLVDIEVETYDGWRATAKTFASDPLAQLHAEVVPTERYMKRLRDGAADNYLDPLYQAWLSSIETVPSAGLPNEYWDTPARYFGYAFLGIVTLALAGVFLAA